MLNSGNNFSPLLLFFSDKLNHLVRPYRRWAINYLRLVRPTDQPTRYQLSELTPYYGRTFLQQRSLALWSSTRNPDDDGSQSKGACSSSRKKKREEEKTFIKNRIVQLLSTHKKLRGSNSSMRRQAGRKEEEKKKKFDLLQICICLASLDIH